MKWLDGVIDSMGISLCKLREMVKDREVWHAAVHGVTKIRTWFSNSETMLVVNTVMNDREKNITNRLHTVTEGYKENKRVMSGVQIGSKVGTKFKMADLECFLRELIFELRIRISNQWKCWETPSRQRQWQWQSFWCGRGLAVFEDKKED